MAVKHLSELAKTIRSKNAGTDKITFDIIFTEPAYYLAARHSNIFTKDRIAEFMNIDHTRITDFVFFDPAMAIKFTILRERPSGSPGDPDIFGAQQYAPLLGIEIPLLDGA